MMFEIIPSLYVNQILLVPDARLTISLLCMLMGLSSVSYIFFFTHKSSKDYIVILYFIPCHESDGG